MQLIYLLYCIVYPEHKIENFPSLQNIISVKSTKNMYGHKIHNTYNFRNQNRIVIQQRNFENNNTLLTYKIYISFIVCNIITLNYFGKFLIINVETKTILLSTNRSFQYRQFCYI